MPSYAPPKPTPKRSSRVGRVHPLNLNWRVRTANAIGAIRSIPATDPFTTEHLNRALGHLLLLDQATTNRAYRDGHAAALREVGIALHLTTEKHSR